jgi:hypothetical protein
MTDPLPPDSAGAAQPADTPPVPVKKSWPLSRTILLAILAVLLVMLGFDYFHGRMAKDNAYELLSSKYLPDDKSKARIQAAERPQADDIHKTMGRDPDSVEDNPVKATQLMREALGELGDFSVAADKVETYRFAGALRAYVVRVAYKKEKNGDGTTEYRLIDIKGDTEPLF